MKNKKINLILLFILIICPICLFLTGCEKEDNKHLKLITYNELIEKKENKEDFILIISASTCSHCMSYKPKVKEVAKKNDIIVFYFDIDIFDTEEEQDKFLAEFKLTGETPMTLFFKNGQEISILNRLVGDKSIDNITNTFKKMGFI